MKKDSKASFSAMIPLIFVIVASLLALVPFIWAFLSGFKTTNELYGGLSILPKTWRLDNFIDALIGQKLYNNFINSGNITIFVVVFQLIISTLAGYSFAKLKLKEHPFIFYAYLIGMAVPVQATLLAIYVQLKAIGLTDTKPGLILAIIAADIPFATFLMRNFFKDIPDSFGESAQIDGSSEFNTFIKIYIPLAKPAILALLIFTFLSAWNEFNLSLILLVTDTKWTVPLAAANLTAQAAVFGGNFGMIFAFVFMACIPSIIVYMCFQRNFVQGITAGGEKG